MSILGSVDVICAIYMHLMNHHYNIIMITLQLESDAVQAAKADMFGILTRQVEEWHPHRVLCKRFNIPDPYPG